MEGRSLDGRGEHDKVGSAEGARREQRESEGVKPFQGKEGFWVRHTPGSSFLATLR